MAITLRYMGCKEEAEEAANDAFLKVFKNLDRFNYSGPFKAWIGKITVNTCIDRLRKARLTPLIVRLDEVIELPIDEPCFSIDDEAKLLPIIQQLPAQYRAVFNLYVFEDYKHREISDLLGISEGTSKSNYFRAKKILKKKLEKVLVKNESIMKSL